MNNEEATSICLQCLQSHGWKPDSGAALATKEFKTAVGIKVAFAYFVPSDSYNFLLKGDYQSKGRNILSSHGALIPVSTSPEDVRKMASDFAENADAVVACSYAARLYVN